MNWNAVSAIAGVFAAVFVALTVVYLALQIKSSAQAMHSQTYHLATSALAEMAAIISHRLWQEEFSGGAITAMDGSVVVTAAPSIVAPITRGAPPLAAVKVAV